MGYLWRLLDVLRPSSSAGLGSLQTATAMDRMRDQFDLEPYTPDHTCHVLALNDDFNTAITAAHLRHLQDQFDLIGRDAFIAYAFSDDNIGYFVAADFETASLPDALRYDDPCWTMLCLKVESDMARHARKRWERWDTLASEYAYLTTSLSK